MGFWALSPAIVVFYWKSEPIERGRTNCLSSCTSSKVIKKPKCILQKIEIEIRFYCRGRYRNSKTFGFGILIEFGAWTHLNDFLGPVQNVAHIILLSNVQFVLNLIRKVYLVFNDWTVWWYKIRQLWNNNVSFLANVQCFRRWIFTDAGNAN